jgi:hypothetical protein
MSILLFLLLHYLPLLYLVIFDPSGQSTENDLITSGNLNIGNLFVWMFEKNYIITIFIFIQIYSKGF